MKTGREQKRLLDLSEVSAFPIQTMGTELSTAKRLRIKCHQKEYKLCWWDCRSPFVSQVYIEEDD